MKRPEQFNVNTGLREGNRPTDYFAGVNSPIEHEDRNTIGNWYQFLGRPERQSTKIFDRMACTNYSGTNCVDSQINWMLKNNLLTDRTVQWLEDNRFIIDGLFESSDRFSAVMSGTTKKGNWFYEVWDSFRKHADGSGDGVVPELAFPDSEDFTWEEYYQGPPQAIKDLGKEFLKYFEIKYEFVGKVEGEDKIDTLARALRHAPLQVGISTCPDWNSNSIGSCDSTPNHAVMLYNIRDDGSYDIYDHYDPFNKNLREGYYIGSAVKGIVTPIDSVSVEVIDEPEEVVEVNVIPENKVDLKPLFSLFKWVVSIIKKIINKLKNHG